MAGVPAGRLSIELVAEIARLQTDLDKAKKLVNSASNDIAKSARAANDNLAGMAGGITRAGNQSKLASHHMANLSFQIQDIIVGLQGGQKPMTVFLQQGGQIGQIMGQAGIGVGGLAKAVGSMVLNFAKAHPVLLATAAGAGVAAVGLKLFTDQVNAERKGELDAYAKSIGLTKEEIEKAGGAAVTSGDMILGLWDIIKQALELEQVFTDLKDWITSTFRAIAADAKKNISEIYAAIYTIDDALKYAGEHGGEVFAEGIINGLNAAIDAINSFGTIKGPGGEVFWSPNISRIKNDYAGAGKAAAESITASYQKHLKAAEGKFDSAFDSWGKAGFNRATGRLDAALESRKDKAAKAAKKAAKAAADEAQKELQRLIDWMEKNQPKWLGDITKATRALLPNGDETLKAALAEINAKWEGEQRLKDAKRQWAEEDERKHRDLALRTAHEVAEITGLRGAHEFVEALNESLPTLFQDLGADFGKTFAAFSKGAALGGSVAQMVGGSSSGGAIGGGLGQIAGEKLLTKALGKFGDFAGPIGAIAGGLLGGVIGGLLKSTPRASATVSIIAGEAMDTAISGNKSSLKKIAGGLADSVISGLSDLADRLGAQLVGDAKVSIGVSGDSYHVDPTGRGRLKKSQGGIDFDQDQAGAIAYAIQVAIQQGVLGGLSESMKRLIMADGDLQTQISKALSFKDVFDQLAQRDDPAKWAQDQVTAWHDSMAKIFAEAGATADELAELERLTGLKRADAAKEAADKIAQAEREALERQNEIRDKNIELLTALGKVEEAEAMARQARIDDAPDYLRALQAEIEAANALKEQAAAQKVVADQAHELALAIADLANPEQARLMRLADERALIDSANLAAFDRLQALKAEAEATAAAAKAAEELAQKNKAIADEVGGLQRQWLELIGDTKSLRQMDLAGLLSDEARALQQRIWAFKDTQDALKGEIEARNDQISAINSTISALSQASQRWSQMAAQIREYRASLFAPETNGGLSYAQAYTEFQRVSKMAALGNEGSLQAFTGTAQSFLSSALANATSLVDYQRAIGLVAGASDAAAAGADSMARATADQYAVLLAQRGELEELNAQTQAQLETLAQTADVQASDVVPTLKELLRAEKEKADKAEATRAEEKAESIALINLLVEQNAMLRRAMPNGDGFNTYVEGGSVSAKITNDETDPVRTLEVTP